MQKFPFLFSVCQWSPVPVRDCDISITWNMQKNPACEQVGQSQFLSSPRLGVWRAVHSSVNIPSWTRLFSLLCAVYLPIKWWCCWSPTYSHSESYQWKLQYKSCQELPPDHWRKHSAAAGVHFMWLTASLQESVQWASPMWANLWGFVFWGYLGKVEPPRSTKRYTTTSAKFKNTVIMELSTILQPGFHFTMVGRWVSPQKLYVGAFCRT